MKKFATLVLAVSIMTISLQSAAGDKIMEVAAHLDLGGASAYGSEFDGLDSSEKGPRFAAGIGGNFYYFLTPMLALDAGLQFTGRGYSIEIQGVDGKSRTTWLELPVGVVADIDNLYLGFAFSFNFAIANEMQSTFMGIDASIDNVWDGERRFNIAPKLTAAYAIPVGPVELFPGAAWSMNLLNERDDAFDTSRRSMNFMVTLGVKYGLPVTGPTI